MALTTRGRKARKARTLPMGTISHDTLRTEDLFPALRAAIGRIRLSRADRATFRKLCKEWDPLIAELEALGDDEPNADQMTEADELYEELRQLAESYVPEYAYLSLHKGDGADLGVWASVDSVIEAARAGEIWRECSRGDGYTVPGTIALQVPRGELWVSVSDHGNVTLYRSLGAGKSREIWGVV